MKKVLLEEKVVRKGQKGRKSMKMPIAILFP